jgi:MFS family permease
MITEPEAGMIETERRSMFRSREFAFVLLAYFFAFFSIALFYLFPLFLERFHPSKIRVGLIMGIQSITAILVRPLFGRFLDEQGGRKAALASILFMIAVISGFHLVRSAGILVILLRALNGVGWGIAATAILAICSDLAPANRMAHSLGVVGIAGIIAEAVGPTVAEEVSRRVGFGGVFNMSLVLLAAAFLCVAAIRQPRPRGDAREIERTPSLANYRLPILIVMASMPVVHGAVRGTIINFIALFGTSAGFARVGPFFLAFSTAAILMRLVLGDLSDRYGRKRVIVPTAVLIGLNLFWIAGVRSYAAYLIGGFAAGLGQGLMFPALSTYVIDLLGRGKKGLALGIYLSLVDVGTGLGSPLFGWVSDRIGYRGMYGVAGCLILLFAAVFHAKAPGAPSQSPADSHAAES